MKNKFKAFLKEQKLTEAYVRMFMLRRLEGDYKKVSEFLSESDPEDYIAGLYEWIKTTECHDFWSKVDVEWLKILSNETKS